MIDTWDLATEAVEDYFGEAHLSTPSMRNTAIYGGEVALDYAKTCWMVALWLGEWARRTHGECRACVRLLNPGADREVEYELCEPCIERELDK